MTGESSIGHTTLQRKAEIPGLQPRVRAPLTKAFAQYAPGLAAGRPHPRHVPLIDKKLQFEEAHLRQREHPGTSTEHLQPGTYNQQALPPRRQAQWGRMLAMREAQNVATIANTKNLLTRLNNGTPMPQGYS
ncbi:hypothetical protein PPUJ20005_42540 [Pseudomonas putida]|uniref:Uncharacterized protein n=1 Tax=Pseudomonas putida NBRC 14164 TaxID=1211579 RepID=A0ABN5UIX8_PSEPU|nr:hypothetical protein PP4_16610 [Pseudomonas putida NBRC 14164]GLO10285.1 hypothetical protein PPUJ20005_42540 [Pseudomonas putida]